jgi:hypothetical protein
VAQVVEHLPSKGEALSSNPSTAKKKNLRVFNGASSLENFKSVSVSTRFIERVAKLWKLSHSLAEV